MYISVVTPDLCCPLFPEPDAAPVDRGLLNANKVILHQTRWTLSQISKYCSLLKTGVCFLHLWPEFKLSKTSLDCFIGGQLYFPAVCYPVYATFRSTKILYPHGRRALEASVLRDKVRKRAFWLHVKCEDWDHMLLLWELFFNIKCDLKNTTRKRKSKLYVGFAETSASKWSTSIYFAASVQRKLWFIGAFKCPKCFWITYSQIIWLNNLFLEKALMWTTLYLHQLPFHSSVFVSGSFLPSSHAPAPRCA